MNPAPLKLLFIAGARPNFMKIAPLIKAAQAHNASTRNGEPKLDWRLVHTGQHYDAQMSEVFFRDLGIPAPAFNLDVGSGSHAVQTARIMERFEPVLLNAFGGDQGEGLDQGTKGLKDQGTDAPTHRPTDPPTHRPTAKPDWLIVVGDVNSTLACTLVASKLGIKVAHVEAGLRSFDRTMPEEINRVLTDAVADLLLTPSEDADANLQREGIPDSKIRQVGNIMIDSLVQNLARARGSAILSELELEPQQFAYVTLHRPSNVDDRETLAAIMAELQRLGQQLPVVFALHPRTRKMLGQFGLGANGSQGVRAVGPMGYHDSLCLGENARLVLTDSGGLQEETTYFRTPCLTLRSTTERPLTVTMGSNRLTSIERLSTDIDKVLARPSRFGQVPPLWDGRTAGRTLEALRELA